MRTAIKAAFKFNCRAAFVVAMAGLLIGLATADRAFAQAPAGEAPSTTDADGFKVLIPSATLANNKLQEANVRKIVLAVLKGDDLLRNQQVIFDAYFQKYYFPMRTRTTPEALAELPVERQRFFRDFLEVCTVPEVHAHLADLALAQMKTIVDDNFHPFVRYNAMLLISNLNDTDAVRVGANRTTPEPMQRALPVILDEFNKATNTDAIRVAALIGMVRHLEWENFRNATTPPVAPPLRASVVKALLDLATLKTGPAERDPLGHEWFRRRAIEGLGHSCYTQGQQPVAEAIEKLLKDDTESVAIRCAAASAIGKMTYQAPLKLDPTPTARELGYLAIVACDSELTRLAELKKLEEDRAAKLGAGGVGGGPAGGIGGEGGEGPIRPQPSAGGEGGILGGPAGIGGGLLVEDPKQYRFDPFRRRVRANLYAVQLGLTGGDDKTQTTRGVEKYAKAPADAKYVADIRAAVDKLAKTLEDGGGLDLAALEKDLRSQIKTIEGMTRKLGAVAAPPAEVPADLPPAAGAPAPPGGLPPAPPPPMPAAADAPPGGAAAIGR